MPEPAGQGFMTLLDGVYRTGLPYTGRDVRVRLGDRRQRVIVTDIATGPYGNYSHPAAASAAVPCAFVSAVAEAASCAAPSGSAASIAAASMA